MSIALPQTAFAIFEELIALSKEAAAALEAAPQKPSQVSPQEAQKWARQLQESGLLSPAADLQKIAGTIAQNPSLLISKLIELQLPPEADGVAVTVEKAASSIFGDLVDHDGWRECVT